MKAFARLVFVALLLPVGCMVPVVDSSDAGPSVDASARDTSVPSADAGAPSNDAGAPVTDTGVSPADDASVTPDAGSLDASSRDASGPGDGAADDGAAPPPNRLPPAKRGAPALATFECKSGMTTLAYLDPVAGPGSSVGSASVVAREECSGTVDESTTAGGRVFFRFVPTTCAQVGVATPLECLPLGCSQATLTSTTNYRSYLFGAGLEATPGGYAPSNAEDTSRLVAGPVSASIAQVFQYASPSAPLFGDRMPTTGVRLVGTQITRARQSCTATFVY